MKVGVYIDGLNLYYGGRATVGRSAPGWRWLDLPTERTAAHALSRMVRTGCDGSAGCVLHLRS